MNIKNLKRYVSVLGCGHQGLAMAAHLSLHGLAVKLWNRTENNISEIIQKKYINCDGIVEGKAYIDTVSTNIETVISDLIMITTPSTAHEDIARLIAPYVSSKMIIVLNPGRSFGSLAFANELIAAGAKELPHIAETQTIVYTCRKKSINSATIFALKRDVKISSLKNNDLKYIMDNIPECLKEYFMPVDSFLETSLGNVGMILHCAPVLMNIGWIETPFAEFKYYYDGISVTVAHYLERLDEERISVGRKLGCDLESVKEWLERTYNISGNDLFECIRNNSSYKEIDAPKTLNTRYIQEDIPNGLVPIEYLAMDLGISCPIISNLIDYANIIFECDFRKEGRKYSVDDLDFFRGR